MSTLPTLKVEIAFDDAWDGVEPITWTDITNKVRAGSIRQGRSNELDQISAGVLNLTLDNRTRTFDPFYASGPYYGKLTTRKQIRVTATYSSTTYPLFRGHVSSWPLTPDTSTDMVCQIEAYDLLSHLATVQLPPDLFTYHTALYAGADAYWFPMGNNGQICADKWRYGSKTTGSDYTFTIASPKTSQAPSDWMTGSATQFDGTYGAIGPAIKPGTVSIVSFLIKTTTAGTTGKLNPILASANPAPDAFIVGVNDTGHLEVAQNTGLGSVSVATSLPINDGNWHHVELNINDTTPTFSITVDGYELGTGTGFTGWRGIQMIGMCIDTGIADPYFTGELAHVILSQNGTGGYGHEYFRYGYGPNDTYSAIVTNIANFANLGTYFSTSLASYPCPLPGGQKWNKPALTALQEITASLGGRLYVDQSGIVNVLPLAHDYTDSASTTVQATFSDSGAAGTINYHDIGGIVFSDEFLYNQVTVTTADGAAFAAKDSTSETNYGVRSRQIDTSLRNLTDADTLANQMLTGYAEPIMRFKDWKVAAHGQPSAYPQLLGLWLGDRVKVEIIPNSVGSRLSQELFVEQITHEFVPGEWHVTLSGSPARNGWSLEDATYGLLESTTILG